MLNTLVVGGLGITLVLFLTTTLTLVFGGVPQKQNKKTECVGCARLKTLVLGHVTIYIGIHLHNIRHFI
jgi:hypothetical protein